jgi:hypothetical protein
LVWSGLVNGCCPLPAQWKQHRSEGANSTQKLSFVRIQRQNWMSVLCNIITLVLFRAKVFILQGITIVLRGTVNKMPPYFNMPSIHTIDDVHTNLLS